VNKIFRYFAFILCTTLFFSCGSQSKKSYVIGVDPFFYSIETQGREVSILAFLTDLLKEISHTSTMDISIRQVNWDSLFQGLQEKQYQGIFSGLSPYNFVMEKYSFSPLILPTGPVLVVQTNSKTDSFNKLANREVGVISDSNAVEIVQKYETIIIRNYDSIPKMLNDVMVGKIEGAVAAVLPVLGYVNDLYQGRIKITTPPLTNQGLRMISLKGTDPEFQKKFDTAFEKIKNNGKLEKLLTKWNLNLEKP